MNNEKKIHLKKIATSIYSYSHLLVYNTKQTSFIFVLYILCLNSAIAGGPWTPGKNKGFIQTQFTLPLTYTKQLFLANGTKYNMPRKIGDYTFQLYSEIGITNKTSFTAVLPAKYVVTKGDVINSENTTPSGNLTGLGNIELMIKNNFYNKNILASGSIKVELPSGRIDSTSGLYTAYPSFAIVPAIHIGKGFANNFYTFSEIGYTFRTNKYSNEIRWLYEAGKKVNKFLWIAMVLDVRLSMYNGTYYSFINEQTGLYSNNQEWFSYGLKLAYEHEEKIGFTISGFGAAYGNLSAKAPFLNIGTFIKW